MAAKIRFLSDRAQNCGLINYKARNKASPLKFYAKSVIALRLR